MCMCGGCDQCMSDQGYGDYDPEEQFDAEMERCAEQDRHAKDMEERSYRIMMLLGEEPEE